MFLPGNKMQDNQDWYSDGIFLQAESIRIKFGLFWLKNTPDIFGNKFV